MEQAQMSKIFSLISQDVDMVIVLRTELASTLPVFCDIHNLWQTKNKGDGDSVRWMDHYCPEEYSLKYPYIAKYLSENGHNGETMIYYFSF